MPGFGVGGGFAFEVGVGQVVQRDAFLQTEERLDGAEHVILNGCPVLYQHIGRPIQGHMRHPVEIHVDQFSQRALRLQPLPGSQFAARFSHSADDAA